MIITLLEIILCHMDTEIIIYVTTDVYRCGRVSNFYLKRTETLSYKHNKSIANYHN